MKIPAANLKKLMIKVLSSKHYSLEEAEKIAEVLIYAERTGKNTQGVLKLMGSEPAQDIAPREQISVKRETPVSALMSGGGAAGPLIAQLATQKVIDIARKSGIGIVGVNDIFSSISAISYYVRKIAEAGYIGIACANSPRAIAHWGGLEPAYGTNPIAFGFPTQDYPIVFDTASSAITWYGLVRAKALGEPLPNDVALDSVGEITKDPEAAMAGSILPFDRSYKGSGFAMTVELLAGALAGAHVVFDEGDWGATFIAIDPEVLVGAEKFKATASHLVERVKAGKPREGMTIHIPGFDTESAIANANSDEIELPDEIWKKLEELAK